MSSKLDLELSEFLEAMNVDLLLVDFDEADKVEAINLISTFKNEAHVALSLVQDLLDRDMKILEVGAGLCLLSLFLKQEGFNIVACEPMEGGFGFFEKLKNTILLNYSHIGLEVIGKSAQDLSLDADGEFDLIFSNNVIEHIIELEAAMFAMSSVLSGNAKMVHGCPNYVVPYEPHFGLPVIAFLPNLTKSLWPKEIASNLEVWESLNFITYFRLKRIARHQGLSISFKPELTYDAFCRLRNDVLFQERHRHTIVGKVFRLFEMFGVLGLTRFLPAWMSTPMVCFLNKKH